MSKLTGPEKVQGMIDMLQGDLQYSKASLKRQLGDLIYEAQKLIERVDKGTEMGALHLSSLFGSTQSVSQAYHRALRDESKIDGMEYAQEKLAKEE